MSRKDFQAIARVIYAARTEPTTASGPYLVALDRVAENLAGVFAAANPRFDRARFIKACETGKC
jgi:hypothetical protein